MITRLVAGIGAALLALLLPVPAVQAQDTYRYWSYWVADSATWTYSARGPGFRIPPDGGVEGWRFVVSPKDGSQAVPPGAQASYEQLCPGQPAAPAGQKRVAVVVDPGPAGIAPVGDTTPAKNVNCIVADAEDTGLQVLQSVASLRFHSSGLICGIAGFPSTECPGQSTTAVKQAAPAETTPAPNSPTPTPATAKPTSAEVAAAKATTVDPSPTPSTEVKRLEPSPAPSVIALSLGEDTAAPVATSPPVWIAAIGVALIMALFGLAFLARRDRS